MHTMKLLLLSVAVGVGACGGGGGGGSGADGGPDAFVGPDAVVESELDSFCDPATWGGSAPTSASDLTIEAGKTVLVDCDAQAGTLTIAEGGRLLASRMSDSTLTMHGNLIVEGTLDYGSPADRVQAGVIAELIFTGMDDQAMVGNPGTVGTVPAAALVPVASDVGLWIQGNGLFTAAGQPKKSWSRLTESAGPGDATFSVDDASGWLPGDKIMLTPTDPTSVSGYSTNFDEGTVASVSGDTVTLDAAPTHAHAGCADDCLRRGEAANLTRNVVIRSADDQNHAHILSRQQGRVQLDGVELRWLGPEKAGGPERRSALFFHAQRDGSRGSFVRNTAIWGGQQGFLHSEQSDGIEVTNVVGYDSAADGVWGGFSLVGCDDADNCPMLGTARDALFTDVLSAHLIPNIRDDGNRIGYLVHGFAVGGDSGTGCRRCVAAGINGNEGATGFLWNNNIHLPTGLDQVFEDCVSHNQGYNGIRLWQNSATKPPPWQNIKVWSTAEGLFEGAYGNPFEFGNILIVDSLTRDAVLQAVPLDEQQDQVVTRLDGAELGSIFISGYVIVQSNDQAFKNVRFNGTDAVAIAQDHTTCDALSGGSNGDVGNEDDPEDHTCIRNWARIENCVFPAGVLPFDFGWQANKHSVWEVRGFFSPDHPDLPADFDLHRKDNQIAGGSYYAPFDAWLVPR
jgi:hypothetical protein